MGFALKSSLRIETIFDERTERVNSHLFSYPLQNILRKILPQDFFFQDIDDEEDKHKCLTSLREIFPLVKWHMWEEGFSSSTKTISLFLLCYERAEVGRFFYDMVSRWLLPGKPLSVNLFFSTNFKFPELSEDLYSISKMVISFDQDQEMHILQNNLEIIDNEIRLGAHSAFHASRILESKGVTTNQKSSLIQERVSSLVKKRPLDFDYDIFSHIQHFLVSCKEEFKEARGYEHMARIIYVFYLFQKSLLKLIEKERGVRHLSLKLSKARLNLPLGTKNILAIYVGLNFLKENEIFEEKHLVRALYHYIPGMRVIEDSFFVSQNKENNIQTLYLEVEKAGGEDFSFEEIRFLRKALPSELKGSIEQLVRPLFMPRNEEEVMRNIVILSKQLKYVKDLPQMIISFDEQTNTELSFTVILLRILHEGTPDLIEIFSKTHSSLKFHPDRIKNIGIIRKKYKQAAVFRVSLPNSSFLREDHSVDLYKARQHTVLELQKIIGEVRDYNGGMISKQIEMLNSLKVMLGEIGEKQEFLLENFFHSIVPVEMRTVMNPSLLKILFLLLIEIDAKKNQRTEYIFTLEKEACFVMIKTIDKKILSQVLEIVEKMRLAPPKLATVHFQVFETSYLGFIYFEEKSKQEAFLKLLRVFEIESAF